MKIVFSLLTFLLVASQITAQRRPGMPPAVPNIPDLLISGSISGSITYPAAAFTSADTSAKNMFTVKAYQVMGEVITNELKIKVTIEKVNRKHIPIGEDADTKLVYYSIKGLPINKEFVIVFSYLHQPGWKFSNPNHDGSYLFTSAKEQSSMQFAETDPNLLPCKREPKYHGIILPAEAKDEKYNWQIRYGTYGGEN